MVDNVSIIGEIHSKMTQTLNVMGTHSSEYVRRLSGDDAVNTRYGEENDGVVWGIYTAWALFIFTVLTLQLLFPSNYFLPIDRRTSSVACSTLVYISHKFLLKNDPAVDLVEAIDFDVLLLLSAIMIINHIMVHLKETKDFVLWVQQRIQAEPRKGFWLVALSAFFVSPFLTNDGVCLLFVAPILAAFEPLAHGEEIDLRDIEAGEGTKVPAGGMKLDRSDAIYFMFALACSANIGSAMTYTGNPQNMIVASDSIEVMPPIKFLAYMVVPSVISEYITLKYIEYCWLDNRKRMAMAESHPNVGICECCPGVMVKATYPLETSQQSDKRDPLASKGALVPAKMSRRGRDGRRSRSNSNASDTSQAASEASTATAATAASAASAAAVNPAIAGADRATKSTSDNGVLGSTVSLVVCSAEANLPANSMGALSPRPLSLVKPEALERKGGREGVGSKVARIIVSPAPYIMLVLLGVMIVMIFVDVMAISGLICVSAIIMVLTLTYGNHWKGAPMFSEEELGKKQASSGDAKQEAAKGSYAPVGGKVAPTTTVDTVSAGTTHEQRVKIREEFYEEMFESIDYNLLFIFLGLFVVIANLQATGIPKQLWEAIVGPQPFASAGSVIGISAFVLLASQTLGNVAVCQLAVPNIEPLDDDSKRYAWAIVSFVSTIGGNLLLTGSAANLIVAEKAMRVDPTAVMNFSNHARVCFMTCVISCAVGMGTITLCNMIELSLKQ